MVAFPTPSRVRPSLRPALTYESHRGAAWAPLPRPYRRREPETTALHVVVREHLETFLEEARRDDGDGYPRFVEKAFRAYLECGILAHGFARFRCPECAFERLVAFSCKSRLCPSCQGRRMADTAAFLVEERLPQAPYRQWVLTFPWVLRARLAIDRRLVSSLLAAFLRIVFAWQRKRGRALGLFGGRTGAVTFVQRFGSAINLNVHLHSILPDGLFVLERSSVQGSNAAASNALPSTFADSECPTSPPPQQLRFVPLPPPTQAEIETLTKKIARRLTAIVERLGSEEPDSPLNGIAVSMQQALATALRAPVPSSFFEEEELPSSRALCAKVAGFSLHAGQWVRAEDRETLEHLLRYGLRGPIAQERLSLRADGRVVYRLRRPWPHAGGVTELVLEPEELLCRLAALVPARYSHLVRYHGMFANRSADRALLPRPPVRTNGDDALPGPPDTPEPNAEAAPSGPAATSDAPPSAPTPNRSPRSCARLSWARLLKRVFFVDALTCPRCEGNVAMIVLAFLSDPVVVARILRHLGLPDAAPGLAPARGLFAPDLFSAAPIDDAYGQDESPAWDEREREPSMRAQGHTRRPP